MVNTRCIRTRKKKLNSLLMVAPLAVLGWTGIGWSAPLGATPAQDKKAKAKNTTTKPSKPNEKQTTAVPTFRPIEGNLRDPFKLPNLLPETASLQPGEVVIEGPFPPGSRGLIIAQLRLEGIVRQGRDNPKMIAVLANSANRAYFLHENDPLYNGMLTKITADSVYFREDVRDASGKTSSREVIKKLGAASGEKK